MKPNCAGSSEIDIRVQANSIEDTCEVMVVPKT